MKYRKKPIVIEAIKFTGKNYEECREFLGEGNYNNTLNYPNILNITGNVRVSERDYIVKDEWGNYGVMKYDIFETTYEEA